jgi:hypothetical protein
VITAQLDVYLVQIDLVDILCHSDWHTSLFLHFILHFSLFTFHFSLFTFHFSHSIFHTLYFTFHIPQFIIHNS